MTVGELIAELQRTANPDALVLVDGYEGGYDDIAGIAGITVVRDSQPYHGAYQNAEDWPEGERLFVVLLSRLGDEESARPISGADPQWIPK